MKKTLRAFLTFCMVVLTSMNTGGLAMAEQNKQIIYKGAEQTSMQGPAEYFTGSVRVQPLFPSNETAHYGGAYVTFAPAARSNWHTHPAGQHLVVVKGVCWAQTWDGVKSEANVGDAVWCPSGIKHWHGASPDGEMTHLALTGMKDGQNVTWLEKVTDEQYYGK